MPWWKEQPWRMIQTNLREIDMADISAERFVSDLLEFHATVVLLNAAGISAGYDTKLPFHIKNPYLTGDSLKKIVDLCHEKGIRVIARADFSKVRQEVYETHPEWAFRTGDGGVMEQNGYVQTCLCGEYQQKYAFEVIEELFREIPFDGFYCIMGGFQTKDYEFYVHSASKEKETEEERGEFNENDRTKARIIVDGFRTEPEKIMAGEEFDLILTMKNASNEVSASNILFTLEPEMWM